jgi:hypothetical protein
LIRPHPSNFKHYEKILNQDILMYPKPPFNFELGVPETREDVYYFYKSMKESSFVLGVNTSAMIEAVINNSPVISFMHPKYKKTQEQAVHFKHLIQSESIYIVDNEKDFIIKARSIVQNEALERIEKRKEFVQSFIRPLGLKDSAGYIQAHAIHEEIQKQG